MDNDTTVNTRDRTPTVSIAMPVYNSERYLRLSLDSILAQTYTDLEVVISDNGSSDATEALCRDYASRDGRIRYFRYDENRGASWNYNNATKLSRGNYIKHAAYDDLLAPTYLERCVPSLECDPSVVLAYPWSVYIDENGNRMPLGSRNYYGLRLNLNSAKPHERFKVYHHNCNENSGADPVFGLMRAATLRQTPVVGNYIGSDLLLLAEMALRGTFHEVPEELFFIRIHKSSSTQANPDREGRGAWFDPRNRGRLRNELFHWEWLFRYLTAIEQAPIPSIEKIRCYRQMPRWVWRHRTRLVGDLFAGGSLLVEHALGSEWHGRSRLRRVWHGAVATSPTSRENSSQS